MSEAKIHWLVRWTRTEGDEEEEAPTADDAKNKITRLLLDGVRPESIWLYRSVGWNFEIAAHIKPDAPQAAK